MAELSLFIVEGRPVAPRRGEEIAARKKRNAKDPLLATPTRIHLRRVYKRSVSYTRCYAGRGVTTCTIAG